MGGVNEIWYGKRGEFHPAFQELRRLRQIWVSKIRSKDVQEHNYATSLEPEIIRLTNRLGINTDKFFHEMYEDTLSEG